MRDPSKDPTIKGAAAAWHDLCDHAANCADLASSADPAKLPVTDDYAGALAELDHAAQTGILHLVDDATKRFSATFDLTTGMKNLIAGGAGENELALLGAVLMLRGSMQNVQDAIDQLEK
ncbi:hypothetical protein, partial [Planotetraspora phitsanulokensis]